jgi:hypothetical protein
VTGTIDPSPAARAPWPFGDPVAIALLGLLEVELRRWRRRGRVVGACRVEIGRDGADWPGDEVDLGSLRERMDGRSKADWPELVEQEVLTWFESSSASLAEQSSSEQSLFGAGCVDGPVGGWARSRVGLRSRLLPAPAADAPGPLDAVSREVADGLVEVLLSEHARPGEPGAGLVGLDRLEAWGVEAAEAFRVARQNVWAEGRLEREEFTLDDVPVTALFGAGHCATTNVFRLGEYLDGEPDWMPEHGALVVLPHRHLLVVHVIESAAATAAAAGALVRFAGRQYETSPGPITDQLYWWRADSLCRLPSDCVGETLQIFPTAEFTDLLNRLRDE